MIGEKFGKWTVIGAIREEGKRGYFFLCRCECGFEKNMRKYPLIKGTSTGCEKCYRASFKVYSPGTKFNNWTVIEKRDGYWAETSYLCQCICGNENIVRRSDLVNSRSKGCRPCAMKINGLSTAFKKNWSIKGL